MENLGQILQITTLIAFVGTAIKFFVTIGEYKAIINTKIEGIEKELKGLKKENEKLEQEVSQLKADTNGSISRMEALLIEVKTKLELLMQMSGMSENGKFKK